METIDLFLNSVKSNIPVSEVVDLLRYMHSYYEECVSAGRAYDDMVHMIKGNTYSEPLMAQAVLDGAKSARDAEIAHIHNAMLCKLRNFFEKYTYQNEDEK